MSQTTPEPEPDFATTRWRLGYRTDEVDAFVAELGVALRAEKPGMAPYEIADRRFPAARLRGGYRMREVDDYLDWAQEALRKRHGADAVADLEGHLTPPRHVPTAWIYAVAVLLMVAMVVFVVTQL